LADEDIRKIVAERERGVREEAPTRAAEAATIILDEVKADRWRIVVGEDAHRLDEVVRQSLPATRPGYVAVPPDLGQFLGLRSASALGQIRSNIACRTIGNCAPIGS